MSEELHNRVKDHDYRLSSLEDGTSKVLNALDKLTDAMNNQATQFAVYASKHDTVSAELNTVKAEMKAHGETLAAIKPVVDGVRGLIWKVVAAALIGGTGVATVIVALLNYGSGG